MVEAVRTHPVEYFYAFAEYNKRANRRKNRGHPNGEDLQVVGEQKQRRRSECGAEVLPFMLMQIGGLQTILQNVFRRNGPRSSDDAWPEVGCPKNLT